jgi:hypothetical protein
MNDKQNRDTCSYCGKLQKEWGGEGITFSTGSYCSEKCSRSGQSGRRDPNAPERAAISDEKDDAYEANDMQPPLDEAPVEAGGARED